MTVVCLVFFHQEPGLGKESLPGGNFSAELLWSSSFVSRSLSQPALPPALQHLLLSKGTGAQEQTQETPAPGQGLGGKFVT